MKAVGGISTARGLALTALIVVLLASTVNSVATAVEAQNNCQSIQEIDARLVTVFKQTKEELTSGSRDEDLQRLYGYTPVKQPNGEVIPRWLNLKRQAIKQYSSLITQFKEEKCPLPILGISHQD